MARFFDGIDDYGTFGSFPTITNLPGQRLTYTFWIKRELPAIIEEEPSYIISKITPALNLYGWSITTTENGSVTYTERMTDANRIAIAPMLIPLSEWYFVAITVGKATEFGQITFYGSKVGEAASVKSVSNSLGAGIVRGDTTFGLRVAHFTAPSTQNLPFTGMFHGTLYDMRIYREILTLNDINRVRCGLPIATGAAFRIMVLGTGQNESDLSGNGNSGKVFGALQVEDVGAVPCYGVFGIDIPPPTPSITPIPLIHEPLAAAGGNEHATFAADTGPVSADFGSRSPTKYWPIRARRPGHRSKHGGRYH